MGPAQPRCKSCALVAGMSADSRAPAVSHPCHLPHAGGSPEKAFPADALSHLLHSRKSTQTP